MLWLFDGTFLSPTRYLVFVSLDVLLCNRTHSLVACLRASDATSIFQQLTLTTLLTVMSQSFRFWQCQLLVTFMSALDLRSAHFGGEPDNATPFLPLVGHFRTFSKSVVKIGGTGLSNVCHRKRLTFIHLFLTVQDLQPCSTVA